MKFRSENRIYQKSIINPLCSANGPPGRNVPPSHHLGDVLHKENDVGAGEGYRFKPESAECEGARLEFTVSGKCHCKKYAEEDFTTGRGWECLQACPSLPESSNKPHLR